MNKYLYFSIVICIFSCKNDYSPKPNGYPRIDLPQKTYALFKNNCPYQFQKAEFCKIHFDYKNNCWFDLEFPDFNGKLHVTYKNLDQDINELTEETRALAYKHAQIAEAISEQLFINESNNVYGISYTFQGKTATPMQFYITDSLSHFVRGALYFNSAQNDSITPIVNFVKRDIYRLIESWEWK